MKLEIPTFSGSLDIESFIDWVYEADQFFDMAYVPEETLLESMSNCVKILRRKLVFCVEKIVFASKYCVEYRRHKSPDAIIASDFRRKL